jgi:hypothetical protein
VGLRMYIFAASREGVELRATNLVAVWFPAAFRFNLIK